MKFLGSRFQQINGIKAVWKLTAAIFTVSALSIGMCFSGDKKSAGEKVTPPKADFNVAIIHGTYSKYGKNMHHNEFDTPVKQLGWDSKKYASTVADMNRLAGIASPEMTAAEHLDADVAASVPKKAEPENELMKYDMVLGCPLFNFENKVDMKQYAKYFREFVMNGGALVMTDCLYPEVYSWLYQIDPSLTFGFSGSCGAKRDPIDATPPSPFRFLPNVKRDYNTWGHLTLPENNQWEVVLRCGDGHPVILAKRMGKGFIYATALRQPNRETLENLRANLELQRMGLTVTKFEMPEIKTGSGKLEITLKNTTDKAVAANGILSITPEDGSGKALSFTGNNTLEPDKESTISIPYENGLRGKLNAKFALSSEKNKATIFDRNITLPDLLTVLPPRYRSLALESELKKNGEIFIGFSIAPFKENINTLKVKTQVETTDGKRVGKADERKVSELQSRFPVRVGALAPGEYKITSEILENGKPKEKRTAPFTVLKDSECRTFINDDMNLIVDGKPFFPLGLYHISPKDLEQFGQELGINTIQLWSWDRNGLKIAEKYGIKVIWEQNHRNPDNVNGTINNQKEREKGSPQVIDDPNIMAWYANDEPYESEIEKATKLTEAFHKTDISRPTYMVSCQPRLFPAHAGTADIMAPDPYPYHKPEDKITMVADWVDKAWAATKGDKPVICVPQVFGVETEGPFRAMAYLAVTHEARGLIWYPWDDGKSDKNPRGGTGLKYNPELQMVFKDVVSQIKTLSPALLNKEGRKQFKSADGKIHGLFCQEKNKKRYMLLVNPYNEQNTLPLNTIEGLKGVSELKELFGDGKANTAEPLIMKPYETKAYTW